VELIKAGAIGKVTRVHTWVTRPDGGYCGADRSKGSARIPDGLNWDLWLGPAPERPYLSKVYHPFAWRGWWDFGGGHLSDMACHHMDLPHWALDLRYPTSVEAVDGMPVHPETTPIWLAVDYRYPARGELPPVHLTWYHGGSGNQPKELAELAEQKEIDRRQWGAGNLFVGDKGMLIADYGKHRLLPKKDFESFERPPKSIPASIGHHAEWVKACREGTPTTCNFDYSGALAETVLLGNVAYRLGKRIDWDGEGFEAKNAPDAAKFIGKEYRKGWEA
jgi:predicted dehydrogenase